MDYFEDTLLILNTIKDKDDDIIAFFAFGSFVTKETTWKNYKEIRIFDKGEFVLSKFNLTNIDPDIDLLCISNNPESTKEIINRNIKNVDNHFITINITSKEVFEKELSSQEPGAIKRIILYRDLLIIKGQKYIDKVRREYKKYEGDLDLVFQKEFDFRKGYLKLFAKNNIKTLILDKNDHTKLFPNILKFIGGDLEAGFPKDRLKLVYPKAMGLKSEVDLSKIELKDII